MNLNPTESEKLVMRYLLNWPESRNQVWKLYAVRGLELLWNWPRYRDISDALLTHGMHKEAARKWIDMWFEDIKFESMRRAKQRVQKNMPSLEGDDPKYRSNRKKGQDVMNGSGIPWHEGR